MDVEADVVVVEARVDEPVVVVEDVVVGEVAAVLAPIVVPLPITVSKPPSVFDPVVGVAVATGNGADWFTTLP